MKISMSILAGACLFLGSSLLPAGGEDPVELAAARALEHLGVHLTTRVYNRETPVLELDLFLSPLDPVTGNQYAPISRLKLLRQGKLTGAPINDSYLEHFASLEKLESIELVDTQITDKSLEILSHLKSLRKVTLAFCAKVTDRGVSHLSRLGNLQELTLTDLSGLSGSDFGALRSLTKLRSLDLSWSPVNDEGIAALATLPALERLVVVESMVGDQSLKVFEKMPKLRELTLEDTKVTKDGRESLRRMRPDLIVKE